MFSYVQNM
jgi:hypothetical protein